MDEKMEKPNDRPAEKSSAGSDPEIYRVSKTVSGPVTSSSCGADESCSTYESCPANEPSCGCQGYSCSCKGYSCGCVGYSGGCGCVGDHCSCNKQSVPCSHCYNNVPPVCSPQETSCGCEGYDPADALYQEGHCPGCYTGEPEGSDISKGPASVPSNYENSGSAAGIEIICEGGTGRSGTSGMIQLLIDRLIMDGINYMITSGWREKFFSSTEKKMLVDTGQHGKRNAFDLQFNNLKISNVDTRTRAGLERIIRALRSANIPFRLGFYPSRFGGSNNDVLHVDTAVQAGGSVGWIGIDKSYAKDLCKSQIKGDKPEYLYPSEIGAPNTLEGLMDWLQYHGAIYGPSDPCYEYDAPVACSCNPQHPCPCEPVSCTPQAEPCAQQCGGVYHCPDIPPEECTYQPDCRGEPIV